MALENPVVVAACIAASASLVVSITTAVLARRQSTAVERLRRQLELRGEETRAVLKFIEKTISGIQVFRDTLRTIVDSLPSEVSAASVLSSLRDAAAAYEREYQSGAGVANNELSRVAHAAKTLMLGCVSRMRIALAAGDSVLSEHDREYLREVRDELRHMQSQLTAMRAEAVVHFGDDAG